MMTRGDQRALRGAHARNARSVVQCRGVAEASREMVVRNPFPVFIFDVLLHT